MLLYKPTNIASTGTANSFIKASHVTKTRHAHQVTAATLHGLMQWASETTKTKRDIMTMDQWCAMRAHKMFSLTKTLSLEILMLLYIRANLIFNYTRSHWRRLSHGCLLSTTYTIVGGYLYTFDAALLETSWCPRGNPCWNICGAQDRQ